MKQRANVRQVVRSLLFASSTLALIGTAFSASPDDAWTLHSSVGSPDDLKLFGTVRTRYEALEGQPRPGLADSPDLLNFRTTLFAEYSTGPLRIGGELYDSRAYLGEAESGISTGEVNALELVQAYVAADLKNTFGANTSAAFQAGRFTLNLGSRRFVAADDYRNTTNGYTGLRTDFRREGGATATFIYTLPQRRLPEDIPSLLDNDIELDSEGSDLVLWGGLVTVPKALGNESV